MRPIAVRLTLGLSLGMLALAGPAHAQGYGVYEQSACAMGRAGAVVATPCADGSSIAYNPAGLTLITKKTLSLGAAVIIPPTKFTADFNGQVTDSKDAAYFVPNAYYAQPLGKKLALGVGVFAPYGLTTEWPLDFEGRFLGFKSQIKSLYFQPTIAYKVNDWLSVGGGFDVVYGSVNLQQQQDLSVQQVPGAPAGITFANLGIPPLTQFAAVDLSASHVGVGGHFGIMVKPIEKLSIGARYLLPVSMPFNSGTADFSQVSTDIILPKDNPFGVPAGTPMDTVLARSGIFSTGPLVDQTGTTKLTFPGQLVVGGSYQFTPKLVVEFDWLYGWWSAFDTLSIGFEKLPTKNIVESYQDVSSFRLGGEYQAAKNTSVRLGFESNQPAAPDQTVTPNLPESARSQFSIGIGQQFSTKWHLDAYFLYVDQAARRGRTSDGGMSAPTTAVNDGLYQGKAYIFGASIVYTF